MRDHFAESTSAAASLLVPVACFVAALGEPCFEHARFLCVDVVATSRSWRGSPCSVADAIFNHAAVCPTQEERACEDGGTDAKEGEGCY